MQKHQDQTTSAQLSQEEIQGLIATSTGVIDAYVIPAFGNRDILLPQNMILSAMNVPSGTQKVEWHETLLPTYAIHKPDLKEVTALVIDADTEQERFAILCDSMPQTLRLRISEVIDIDRPVAGEVYQYVNVNDKEYQIPNLSYIQAQLLR